MAEVDGTLIMEVLRKIQADGAATRVDLQDLKVRMTSLDQKVSLLHGDFANQSLRIDRIENRLERIEKRLGLLDETH